MTGTAEGPAGVPVPFGTAARTEREYRRGMNVDRAVIAPNAPVRRGWLARTGQVGGNLLLAIALVWALPALFAVVIAIGKLLANAF